MSELIVRHLGLRDYGFTVETMQAFTENRSAGTADEVWLLEHPPVFTLGRGAAAEHVLNPGPIPVVRTDRGGQVTYHGPGQLVVYVLIDLQRRRLGIRQFVRLLEATVIALLADYAVTAVARPGAPGVYVAEQKIASMGLRVRRGCTYHGLSLNVGMDLEPFCRINPCGFPGLKVTDLRTLLGEARAQMEPVAADWLRALTGRLDYDTIDTVDERTAQTRSSLVTANAAIS